MDTVINNKFNHILNKALELGVEKAKVIDTNTIFVGEWVQLKCKYGCPFYGKDAFHPPLAPNADEMKKILKEYSKALLINSSQGSLLSKLAINLEHEAVNLGYYKAFAIIALPFGKEST